MKHTHHRKQGSILLAMALSTLSYADDPYQDAYSPQISNNTSELKSYVANLGAYIGYDITSSPNTPNGPVSALLSSTSKQLLTAASSQLPFFTTLFDTFLGSIPVNTLAAQFVPQNNPTYSPINALANITFPSYSSAQSSSGGAAASGQASLSANSQIDQPTYQQDPVNQALLNTLGTPDISYCMTMVTPTNATVQWTGGTTPSQGNGTESQPYPTCNYLYNTQVMSNVIGQLPTPDKLLSNNNSNQQLLSQLNSNSLLAPLMYSNTNSSSTQTSSSSPNGNNNGLSAQGQAQQAANFIRYATGSVVPTSFPTQSDYATLYDSAVNASKTTTLTDQITAQTALSTYFTRLRVFAAQTSVGYSNLYYMLSKRLPQSTGGSGSSATSQALNEFTMATWRLYNPAGGPNTQWLSEINQASPTTVQKEMVTLLAEINYQLYLTRQQQERLLLTNTMLLLLSSRTTAPKAPTVNSVQNNAP